MNTEFSLDMAKRNRAIDAIGDLQLEAFDNAEEHGFHKDYNALMEAVPVELKRAQRRTILLAKLALISSEVGEAVRAVQHANEDEMETELADIVIRILDMCGTEYIELGRVLLVKMMANRRRPYLHGKQI